MRVRLRHATAGIGAASAHFRASGHAWIIRHSLTVGGASFTHFGAGAADVSVQVRAAQHEIGTRLADLCAVHHDANVIRLRMHPSLLQAIRHCLQRCFVAVTADLNGGEHIIIR